MTQELSFDAWCDEIDRLAHDKYRFADKQITVASGREHLLEQYKLGDTPEDALIDSFIDP